jgi:nitroreductase
MEFAEVLRRRRMIRSYDATKPVPPAALEAVLGAALRAPSAGFTQGISLLVLHSAAERETFWQTCADSDSAWLQGMQKAPVLIAVWTSQQTYLDRYAEPDKGWTDRDPARWSAPYWFVDAGMASMAALLSAVDQHLGACFFGIPADRIAAVRQAFGVPTSQLSVGVISLGYPAAPGMRHEPVEGRAPTMRPEPVEGRSFTSSAPITGSPTRRPRKDPSELIHRGVW